MRKILRSQRAYVFAKKDRGGARKQHAWSESALRSAGGLSLEGYVVKV